MKLARQHLVAAAYGFLCHASFAAAIGAMVLALFTGMQSGLGSLHGPLAWLADAALLLQFPLLHSWLLTARGQTALRRMAPARFATPLLPTLYATVAAWQLLLVFLLWSPLGPTFWLPRGLAWTLHVLAFAGAWLFLGKALLDAGLGLQTGWIGWRAVWRGTPPRYPGLPQHGLFRRCRQPIYLGFALTLWTGPHWTPDHLFLAVAWSTYCVLGPLHKERRFAALHGEAFAQYQSRVPYLVPRLFR